MSKKKDILFTTVSWMYENRKTIAVLFTAFVTFIGADVITEEPLLAYVADATISILT